MDNIYAEQIYDKFFQVTKKPEKFLSAPEKLIDNIKECLKETYDFIKKNENVKISNTLPTLIVNNFDVEQIWQQIELQNDGILSKHIKSVGHLVAQKDNLWLINDDDNEKNDDDSNEKNDDDDEANNYDNENNVTTDDEDNTTNDDKNKTTEENNVEKTTNVKKSSVDDDFFKLDEMEKFLNLDDKNPNSQKEDSDDEESVDLFDMKSDEDEDKEDVSDAENNPKYNEFFGENNETVNRKRPRSAEESSDNDDDSEFEKEDIQLKSSLELKNERLHKLIENIEEQALQDKSWQYKGEVTADKRPQNSLLEEIVDFDMTVRPAPVITEQTTYKLEDVIKKRIKDKVWDDVERKTKLVDTFFEYKKKLMLDQEKSKQSLAQIYEEEYLKQKEALNPDASEKPDEEPIEHTEIKSKMKSLFIKLDALSNFHFTPKSIAPELRIVNNLPAINMEEVTPIAASESTLLAPEEIKKKTKGVMIGKTERTKTDKNRERRQKKLKQREHAKKINEKKTGLSKKYDKQKAVHLLEKVTRDNNVNKMNESKDGIKSSTSFFTQLQDEVRGHIKKKNQIEKNKNKPTHVAKKLKL